MTPAAEQLRLAAFVAEARPPPEVCSNALQDPYLAHEHASRLIAGLAVVSLTMIFIVLCNRDRATVMSLIMVGSSRPTPGGKVGRTD